MAIAGINSGLPWQGLAAGGNALSGLGGNPQQAMAALGPMYQQQYQAALGMNQQNYNNITSGYDSLRQNVDTIYGNVLTNYDKLYGDVLNRIEGTNATNINDINRNAEAQSGAASQQMVSRGLGNTTVQQNMQRAIALDRARAQTDSQNQFAQLQAQYANQIGQGKLGAQERRGQMNAQLGQGQLVAMERVNAGYPDAAMFGSLAQMYGAQAEADKNRKMQQQALARAGQGQMSSGGYSYSPSPWGSRNPAGSGGGGFMGYDSWSGGGGGGYYQAVRNPEMPVTITNSYNNPGSGDPYAAAMGNAAVYGMGQDDSWNAGMDPELYDAIWAAN